MNAIVPSVLLIGGSLRQPSHTRSLLAAIADRLVHEGAKPEIWDLYARPLPMADPAYHHQPDKHPAAEVRAFVRLSAAADAFVLATPVYHNGPAGVLKNALDHLVIAYLELKPVGFASHGGARTTQAVEQLRIITRGLRGYAITTQVCTADQDFQLAGTEWALTSKPMLDRVERFCRELATMAKMMPYARQILQ